MADSDQPFYDWFHIAVDDPAQFEARCGTAEPWKDDYWQGMLICLIPPDGRGLDRICAGYPHGDEVLQRLLKVFGELAFLNDTNETEFRQPAIENADDETVRELLLQHASGLVAMSELVASEDGVTCAGNPPKLIRVDDPDNVENDMDTNVLLEVDIPSMHEDKFAPDASDNPLSLLTESLYAAAWSYYHIANYVLWPIYRGTSPLVEPFEPAYELWKRGIHFCYASDGVLNYADVE